MTSYSGLWNNEYGENHALLDDDVARGNSRTALSRIFAQRTYGRSAVREVLYALLGSAAGGTASASHKRVQAIADLAGNAQGGARPIETYSAVNRATTSEDLSDLQETLRQTPAPSYPVDKAGNGGGNKLGY